MLPMDGARELAIRTFVARVLLFGREVDDLTALVADVDSSLLEGIEAVITCWQLGWHTGGQQPLHFEEACGHRDWVIQLIVPLMEHREESLSHCPRTLALLRPHPSDQTQRAFWRVFITIAGSLFCDRWPRSLSSPRPA